jgi:AcrR family transcriptional regulator
MPSSRSLRRSIGRPRHGAGVDARELLLDAALALFAEQGVAGTTIAAIAAKAGVTPAMVHYYFTNRDQLVDAVARERLLPTINAVWAPVLDTNDVVPLLRGLVQRIFKVAEVNPRLPSLWLREIVSEGGQLRTPLLKNLRFEYVLHLIKTVSAAQRRGEVDPHIDPRLVVVSVMGNTLLPLAASRMWQQVPVLQSVTREDVARHVEALLASAFSQHRRRRGG